MPIVYLIQPAEYIGTSCYKIGYSRQHGITRMKAYQKGTRFLCIHETEYPCILEKRIIERFNEMFDLACGKEYFRGDEMQMYDEFEALCRDMKCNPPITHDEDDCGHSASENEDGNIDISDNEIDESNESNVHLHTIVTGRGGADIRIFFAKSRRKANQNRGTTEEEQTNQEKQLTCRNGIYICKYCGKNLNRSDSLNRHLKRSKPCHPSHPNYKKVTHCIYCNNWEYNGKTKSQIVAHKTYCKKVHNGITYHDSERKRLREFESNEIKLLRERINILTHKVEKSGCGENIQQSNT